MYLYNFNLNFVYEEKYLASYILYLLKRDNEPIKKVLKDIGLPASSYNYCRVNGFRNSYSTLEILSEKYGVDFSVDEKKVHHLENLLSKIYTECFFVDGKTKEIMKEIEECKDDYSNTILYPLYALCYSACIDIPARTNEYIDIMKEYEVLLEGVYDALDPNIKYYYTVMFGEYYLTVTKKEKFQQTIDRLLELDYFTDDSLKTIGYYDLYTYYYLIGDMKKAYKYSKLCEQLCYTYYNPKRISYIKKNQVALAYKSGDYETAFQEAKNNLLFISREDNKTVMYKTLVLILTTSLIRLGRYEETLTYLNLYEENKFTDFYPHANLMRMFCYYKLNNKPLMFEMFDKVKELTNNNEQDEGYIIGTLILALNSGKKREMVDFGKKLKPIMLNTKSFYNRVCEMLCMEYEHYLRQNGKYIELLDM